MTVGLASFGSTFTGATGQSVLGGFNATSNGFMFLNYAKGGASFQIQNSGSDPTGLSANGYPVTTAQAGYSCRQLLPIVVGEEWVLKWTNNVTGSILLNTGFSYLQITQLGGTVGGITYGTGGQSITGSPVSFIEPFNVARCRIVFKFVNTAAFPDLNFPTGATYHGDMGVVLCRLKDEQALANGEIFTPEWLASIRALNPKTLRFMGQVLNAGDDKTMACQTSYRPSVNAFTWCAEQFPPGLWSGQATQVGDAYSFSSFPPDYATLGGGYVEGMTWQGTFKGLTTNTTTTPTVNLNGLGAKTLLIPSCQPMSVGGVNVSGGANCSFIYDAVMDAVLYQNGGMFYGPPLEIRVAACNALKKDYWHTIPISYTLASVAADAAYIAANLNPGLKCYPELGNENWNTGFNQFAVCALRGRALGFSSSSSYDSYGYQGMRSRQMMALFTSAFAARSATLKRVLGVFAGSTANYNTALLTGSQMAASGAGVGGLGQGNALWTSYTGAADFTQVGQRPVDWHDVLSYAPYIMPSQVGQSDVDYTANIGATHITDLLTNSDLYATGDPTNMATALAWYDNQVRRGTFPSKTVSSVSGGDTFNCTSHGFSNNTALIFSTTGSLPANVSLHEVYYAASVATNTFKIVASIGGTAISGISGGSGTLTVGKTFGVTMLDYDRGGNATIGVFVGGIYPRWEVLANTYSKDVVCYEGGPLQGQAPSTTTCGSLGISTSYGDTYSSGTITSYGSIGALINGYKNSSLAYQMVIDSYKQFMGTDPTSPNFGLLPHSRQPSALSLSGQNQWGLYPGDIMLTTPFQTYYGVQAFNNA